MSKSALESQLALQLQALGIEHEREWRPLKDRRFRVDFAWPAKKLAIEVDGGLYRPKSGHRSFSGVSRDILKGNLLLRAGWTVYRVTDRMIKSGEAVRLVEEALK